MLNARKVKRWLALELGDPPASGLAKHLVACTAAQEKAVAFGINAEGIFGFWDWVGGRFSVSSAAGAVPLALHYGFNVFEMFLKGAHDMDKHFLMAEPLQNLPLLMGLLAVWNLSCLGYKAYAILPYSQALLRFVSHVQQLDMESNGKNVQMHGGATTVATGGVYFGEPGTNGQHSFYQLLHQGRKVPAEFIGFRDPQVRGNPSKGIELTESTIATMAQHDELMANFFAQPEALALGLSEQELSAAQKLNGLALHRTFPGDRPSLSLLLPICNSYWLGQLLALYEHRTVVQAWLWNINPFDQHGVELGKALGKRVRTHINLARQGAIPYNETNLTSSTQRLIQEYLATYPSVHSLSEPAVQG